VTEVGRLGTFRPTAVDRLLDRVRDRMPGQRLAAYCAAGAGLGFAAVAAAVFWRLPHPNWWIAVLVHGVGAFTIVAGAVVWLRARAIRTGQLMVAAGSTFYLSDLRASYQPVVFAGGFCLAYLYAAILAHGALMLPTGRPVAWTTRRVLIPACYLGAVGTQVVRYVVDRPHPPLSYDMARPNTWWARVGSVAAIVLGLIVAAVLAGRWLRATRLRRRPLAPAWAGALVWVALSTVVSLASLVDWPMDVQGRLTAVAAGLGLLTIPIVYLVQLIRANRARWQLALVALDLERSLETNSHPAKLQEVLADILGDPSLRLAFMLDDGSYVDLDGRSLAADRPGPQRASTPVYRRGRLLAVIDHDEALNQQRTVAETAVAAAGMAMENAHLYATLRAQIEQIRTSRLRLATAAFDERRRLQRDLHDSAQQRLFAILILLDVARHHLPVPQAATGDPDLAAAATAVGRAHAQLADAIMTLREMTHGIYPEPLVEHGLAAAVQALCDLSPTPVTLHAPATRWPRHIEITSYFVIAEALANVYRHAHADRAVVTVTVSGDGRGLTVTVYDNGCGGAQGSPGSGLSGLHDRVAAVGGELEITSPPGGGTRLVTRLPLDSAHPSDTLEVP
jgi:signal transduction histidine kinase